VQPEPRTAQASVGTGATSTLLRVMVRTASGTPVCGDGACMLGVRVPVDIVPDAEGHVRPGHGGMSVTPDNPRQLPPHLRPVTLGGIGKLPVFGIAVTALGVELQYRADVKRPKRHGFVEPAGLVSLDRYQAALAATASAWKEVA
jgi:hypothetical protein